MINEYSVNSAYLNLAGLTSGKVCQQPVLCLHGWLDNAASFVPLMAQLPDYHLLAIDWPGHGHSAHRSQDAHYHFIDYVYDLVLLFDHHRWQPIHIVAHSMGGMVAQAFAAAFPQKVASLTLLDSLGFITEDPVKTTLQLRGGMQSRLKLKDKTKPVHLSLESAIKARMAVSDLSHNDATLIVKRGIDSNKGGYTWRADSRLRNSSPYRLTKEQAIQLISDLACPIQLIYGDKGLPLVNDAMQAFLPYYSNFDKYALSGGHHVHMEKAKETARIITAFIEKSAK